ncbi:hypothetical protein [Haloferula sp. A504]|uniref:hypothetical protein n=1 Tax=Haloferula sp. A504 TaxID=3373601 RepID=UPI0031C961B6|nr:hypothetical protein [Verrucomicrobiaceae bacterium E54]
MRVLAGSNGLISGDYCRWKYGYGFKHSAKPLGGGQEIPLIPKKTWVKYISHDESGATVIIAGKKARIPNPNNSNSIMLHLEVFDMPLREVDKDVVRIRLGQPDRVETIGGADCFLYTSKAVTLSRTRYENAYGTGTARVEGHTIDIDTVTRIPIYEVITFQPYSFRVYFDDRGWVSRVEDLVDRTPVWRTK